MRYEENNEKSEENQRRTGTDCGFAGEGGDQEADGRRSRRRPPLGSKKSSVSRRFIKASGQKLRRFLERDLSVYDIAAIVLDGKTYAGNQIVVALGVTMAGEKVLLGFTEASTEN